jgi:hypothetical protein
MATVIRENPRNMQTLVCEAVAAFAAFAAFAAAAAAAAAFAAFAVAAAAKHVTNTSCPRITEVRCAL